MSLDLFHALPDTKKKLWVKAHLDFKDAENCIVWPFGRKASGYCEISGQRLAIHRVMCEHKNGPPPSSNHYAAHSCGRGDRGCINPNHVRWRTPSENQFERFEHQGGVAPRYKLNSETAAKIREMGADATAPAIAKIFGISESNVRLVLTGKTWNTATRPRVFTEDEVREIRSTPWQVKNAQQWADQFGVKKSVIDRIREGRTYRYFEPAKAASEMSPSNSAGDK